MPHSGGSYCLVLQAELLAEVDWEADLQTALESKEKQKKNKNKTKRSDSDSRGESRALWRTTYALMLFYYLLSSYIFFIRRCRKK